MNPGSHQQLHHPYPSAGAAVGVDPAGGSGDRFPQWSAQETRELLMIRAELDPTFMETKRNKLLWEEISSRMREKGYGRSAEQCKSKWKNLVTRYKGCETAEAEAMRQQFPYYNELQAIFAARMQRMLWLEAEGGGSAAATAKRKMTTTAQQFSSEEEESNEESEGYEKPRKKRKAKGGGGSSNPSTSGSNTSVIMKAVKEMMEEFMRQQMQMEMSWMGAYEAREEERRAKEREWKERMEGLEKERMLMERRWREREEERRARGEARAERRDALVTTLLNKLTREDHHHHV